MILTLARHAGSLANMRCSMFALATAAVILGISVPAQAQLQRGQVAPTFSAQAALAGKTYQFNLQQALVNGPVVLYFYPKAFTAGCSLEAQLFAENMPSFEKEQASVIGISADDIDTLKKFSEGPCGSKFAVASDASKNIMKAYGTYQERSGLSGRTTFVIGKDGKIMDSLTSSNPVEHVEFSIKALQTSKTP